MTPAPQPVPAPAPGGYPGVGSNVGIIILCDRDRGLRTKILKTASEVELYIYPTAVSTSYRRFL